jgi:hypothetical protein
MMRVQYDKRVSKTNILLVVMGVMILVPLLQAQLYEVHPLGFQVITQDITSDKNGNLHLLWVKSGSFGPELYYGCIVGNQVTGQVKVATIGSPDTKFCRPRLAVRNDGQTVHIVWGSTSLYHAWRDRLGVWRTETVRGPVTNRKYWGSICAVTQDEAVHVLYQYWNATVEAAPMIYLRKPADGTWSADMSLGTVSGAEYRDPSVFVDSYGGLHASWRGLLKSAPTPYKYAPAGTNLENAETLLIPKASDVLHNAFGDLFVDERGCVHRAIATWTNRGSITMDYSYRNLNGAFTTPTRPSIGDLETKLDTNPAVAADATGRVFVSYYDFVGGAVVVYLSVLQDGTWAKYVVDPNAGSSYNQDIKTSLTAAENGVYGVWRSATKEAILGEIPLVPPSSSVTVTSPNGGEFWPTGSRHIITWTSNNVNGTVVIELYRHFSLVGVIASDVSVSDGTYGWTVGDYVGGVAPNGQGYKICVRSSSDTLDSSNFAFSIMGASSPSVSLTSPDGGESLPLGSVHTISWTSSNWDGAVNIFLDQNDGLVGTIATNVPAAGGTYAWTTGSHRGGTATAGSGYKVRVQTTDGQAQDSSGASFSLTATQAPLTVTSPASGVSWNIRTTQRITWTARGVGGNLSLYLYKGTTNLGAIATGVPVAGGGYNWSAGSLKNGTRVGVWSNYRVSIVSESNRSVNAMSAGAFSLVKPKISVKSPVNGTRWKLVSAQRITWTFSAASGNVDIFLYRNGKFMGRIAEGIPVDALSYSWTAGRYGSGSTAAAGTGYSICIKSASGSPTGWSPGTFTLIR